MSIPILSGAPSALQLGAESAARGALGANQGPDLTKYALVCGALLVAVFGAAWLLRRFLGGAIARRAAARSLQVIDVLPLGGKHRLAVVRCYDRTFLLGLGEKELSAISELDGVIAPRTETPPSRADLTAFAGVLERAVPAAVRTAVLRKEGVLG
jgi:flagellar biosynthetic protein FliO